MRRRGSVHGLDGPYPDTGGSGRAWTPAEVAGKIFKYSDEYRIIVFEVSSAKEEVLRELVQRDWTPTDLARELGKSTSTVYNHLDDLAEMGVLVERRVSAKTRPKTEYSIGDGFVQHVAVLPGQYRERALPLDSHKAAVVRVWNLPQAEFHPFVERMWWRLRTDSDLDFEGGVAAVAVFGSVARGDADADSDIDLLVVVEDEDAKATVDRAFGGVRLQVPEGNKIAVTESYTRRELGSSLARGSSFLEGIQEELHTLYDPDRLLSGWE